MPDFRSKMQNYIVGVLSGGVDLLLSFSLCIGLYSVRLWLR